MNVANFSGAMETIVPTRKDKTMYVKYVRINTNVNMNQIMVLVGNPFLCSIGIDRLVFRCITGFFICFPKQQSASVLAFILELVLIFRVFNVGLISEISMSSANSFTSLNSGSVNRILAAWHASMSSSVIGFET